MTQQTFISTYSVSGTELGPGPVAVSKWTRSLPSWRLRIRAQMQIWEYHKASNHSDTGVGSIVSPGKPWESLSIPTATSMLSGGNWWDSEDGEDSLGGGYSYGLARKFLEPLVIQLSENLLTLYHSFKFTLNLESPMLQMSPGEHVEISALWKPRDRPHQRLVPSVQGWVLWERE